MYNFNPYFAPNMITSQIPFSLPGTPTLAASTAKTFSWSGLFNGIQKTVGTVNQIIPLYQNVKPIISNSKTLFKVMKTLNSNGPINKQENTINTSQTTTNHDTIEITPKVKEKELVEIISSNTPSKPFFN